NQLPPIVVAIASGDSETMFTIGAGMATDTTAGCCIEVKAVVAARAIDASGVSAGVGVGTTSADAVSNPSIIQVRLTKPPLTGDLLPRLFASLDARGIYCRC